eukprot:2628968-Prymnesium_polylepis.2
MLLCPIPLRPLPPDAIRPCAALARAPSSSRVVGRSRAAPLGEKGQHVTPGECSPVTLRCVAATIESRAARGAAPRSILHAPGED